MNRQSWTLWARMAFHDGPPVESLPLPRWAAALFGLMIVPLGLLARAAGQVWHGDL